MAEYTLYIDESETFNNSGKKYFVMSGVSIRKTNYPVIRSEVEELKRKVWDNITGCENYILHEKDISFANFPLNSSKLSAVASCYHIFTDTKKVQLLYNELSKLFKKSDLYIIGVCLDKSALFARYGEKYLNNQLTIAIQLLVEHYCRFLIMNKSTGDICYEAMQPEQNTKIQQRLYELKALGSMYYSPKTIQDYIREIHFVKKSENMIGLQLADFVPNTLGRYVAGMKPKNKNFAKIVRKKLYDGSQDKTYRFGFKVLS
ncbi:MAG: DUF3800 domain-containing protein [Lachnospiraceae bacterium]|nr:DUF3800 domain-containing protein [Lachnospiraceae bacterium]